MRSMRARLLTAAATVVATGALFAPALAATTTVVDETALGGDWEASTRDEGTLAFVTDYGAPTGLGSGALQLATTDTDASSAALGTGLVAGTPLAAVTDLGYWTYQHAGPEWAAPSFQLLVDLDGSFWTTLVYEPYWQNDLGDGAPVESLTWQQWDTLAGKWWSSRTAGSLTAGGGGAPFYTIEQVVEAHPNATVLAVGVKIGTYNPAYVVAADGLTFGTADGVTTYDFEPRTTFVKDDCKAGGWEANFEAGRFKNQGDCVSYFASNGKTHGE
jgi:hypothetical protein